MTNTKPNNACQTSTPACSSKSANNAQQTQAATLRDPECFANIQNALDNIKYPNKRLPPKRDLKGQPKRVPSPIDYLGAIARNLSHGQQSFESSTVSSSSQLMNDSFITSKSALEQSSGSFSNSISTKSADWRVVGEGSASLHGGVENKENIQPGANQNQNQMTSKMEIDPKVFNLIAESTAKPVIPLTSQSPANSNQLTSKPQQFHGQNAVPDVLKQVMDMQVRVHKSIAQNPGLHTSCTWHGSFQNDSSTQGEPGQAAAQEPMSTNDFKNMKQIYSRKVFAGGVPWEATEANILKAFSIKDANGQTVTSMRVQIEYPSRPSSTTAYVSQPEKKSGNGSSQINFRNASTSSSSSSKHSHPKSKPAKVTSNYFPGYIYLIFESGEMVARVIEKCCRTCPNTGKLFFQIEIGPSQSKSALEKSKNQSGNSVGPVTYKKDVEFIPFSMDDSEWVSDTYQEWLAKRDYGENTAFVGALHGQISAAMLCKIMSELFGKVLRVSIDLDRWKYPIGSGKITFAKRESLCLALEVGIVEVVTERFKKRIQIDPYLQNSGCCMCHGTTQLTYFCRDNSCFAYFCKDCWFWRHNAPSGNFDSDQNMRSHIPLTR